MRYLTSMSPALVVHVLLSIGVLMALACTSTPAEPTQNHPLAATALAVSTVSPAPTPVVIQVEEKVAVQEQLRPAAAPTSTPTSEATPTPITPVVVDLLTPSVEPSYKVFEEDGVVYGSGETVDGDPIDLLLNLCLPRTEERGLRPLMVWIHGGGFREGRRETCAEDASRGWVVASIDYRLAKDSPLTGPRVQGFFEQRSRDLSRGDA